MKTLRLLSLLFATTFLNMNIHANNSIELSSKEVSVPESLGNIKVLHDNDGFSVVKGSEVYKVENYNVDKSVRDISTKDLCYLLGRIRDVEINGEMQTFTRVSHQEFKDAIKDQEKIELSKFEKEEATEIISQLESSTYVTVKQNFDGEYIINSRVRLAGGGLFGGSFGAWMGKIGTHLVFQAGILIVVGVVSVVGTPAAGYAVGVALEKSTFVAAEILSTQMALAGGIAGAVITGPV